MLALLTSVMLGVVTRALGDPLIWTDEASRFLMVWLAVIGWWLASRSRVHIRIRFFIDFLPAAWRRRGELVIQLAVALFGVLVAWYGVSLVTRNYDVTATSLPISMSLLYLPVVIAGLVTFVQALAEARESLGRARGASE